jgi:tetratricopeptide (TPR) repeat protein
MDWSGAVKEYETLIKQDPYNGHAWSQMAQGVRQIRRDAIIELTELEDNQASPQEIAAATQRVEEASERAHEVYLQLQKFARYRAMALLQLAVIESYRDNKDQALDYLEEFVERGNHTRRGIANYYEFGQGDYDEVNVLSRVPTNQRLHTEARFWQLVTREREIGMTSQY